MTIQNIYLSGPITGCSYDECTDWRDYARTRIESACQPYDVRVFSPLRGKEYLKGITNLAGSGDEYESLHVLSGKRGIWARDSMDTCRADLLFVNLLGATRVSIGTMFEMAWASSPSNARKVPVITVIENPGEYEGGGNNPHEHWFVEMGTDFRVNNLDAAIHLARLVLFP